jgi:hypothetical protein
LLVTFFYYCYLQWTPAVGGLHCLAMLV